MSEDSDSENEQILQEKLQKIADLLFDMNLEEDDVDDIINDIYEKVTGEAYESDEDDNSDTNEKERQVEASKPVTQKHEPSHQQHPQTSSHNKQSQDKSSQNNQPPRQQPSKTTELTTIISKATTKVNNHKQLDCILLSGGVQTQVYQHVLYCTSHNLDPVAIKKLISQKLKIRSAIKNDHLYLEGTHTRKELEKFYVGTLANSH
jgi:hypothetical protein